MMSRENVFDFDRTPPLMTDNIRFHDENFVEVDLIQCLAQDTLHLIKLKEEKSKSICSNMITVLTLSFEDDKQ